MLHFIFRDSVKGRLTAKKVHWVMGGFLPQKLFPESFKEILGQQKCQGWKLPSHKMEMCACCQFEHL